MSVNIENILKNKTNANIKDGIEIAYDIVFVINANSKGWILDKICRVVERYSDLNCYFLYTERNDRITAPLPVARAYFFAHFSIAFWTMVKYPSIFNGSIFTYFTHFDQGKGISLDELVKFMNVCDHVFVMNSSDRQALISVGVLEDTITAVVGGADPDVFKSHKRGSSVVGFVGAYYPRKQPEKMVALIRSMPDAQFLLLAPGPNDVENAGILWRNWSEFPVLLSLPNLRYVEAPYESYPQYFAQMDVYISLSLQEGGPIPVIEAMMANAIALATNTGFAEDVLTGELTQYILDVDAPVETIVAKVQMALADQRTDVRLIAQHMSWESVGEKILGIMRPTLTMDRLIPQIADGETVNFSMESRGRNFLSRDWSFENSSAQPTQSPAHIAFRLRTPERGQFRIVVWLKLPSNQEYDEGTVDLWQVDLAINGRSVDARQVAASDCAVVEGWLELSEAEAAEPVNLSISLVPLDSVRTSIGVLSASLLDIRWDRLVPVQNGQKYDFTKDGGLNAYQCTRWHSLENSGCWSKETSATVAIFIPPCDTDRHVSLKVIGRVMGAELDGGSGLTIRSVVQGVTTHQDFTFENNSFSQFVLEPIPISAGSSGPILLTFTRDRTFKACDISTRWANDDRDLGFMLQHVLLQA